jgi:shikimate dehydrogenase
VIDGRTLLVGLIGWPVEHSISPAMHNAAFDALGLNWRYLPLPVQPGQVEAAVRGVAALGLRGANVTVPHKQTVMPALDTIAPDARKFGAVNTIVVERSEGGTVTLSGHNTDYTGFVGALRHGGFEPEGKRAVVVGAGGGGRAVVFGLIEAGATEILVLDLTLQQAQALVSDLGGSPARTSGHDSSPSRLHMLPHTTETLVESARVADLLINATPLGMWPRTGDSIWPEGVPIPPHLTVFDLVYTPLETRLLRQARESGAHAIDGLEMLVRQGATAFEMWTSQPAPVEMMRAACERALAR